MAEPPASRAGALVRKYQHPRGWVVKYCKFIHAHVYGCFWASIAVMLLISMIVGGTGLMKMSLPSDYDWNIAGTTDSVHRDMADLAMAQADELGGTGNTVAPLTQSGRFGMTYMYQWDDSDEFVPGSKAKAEAKQLEEETKATALIICEWRPG